MGNANYVFRLDDVASNMNIANFERIMKIMVKYNIKPIIGVIPCNQDPRLAAYGKDSRIEKDVFWLMLRKLQKENGWTIALHGYNHVYCSQNSGILKIHNRSEFAGLSEAEQNKKISEGKRILEAKGLQISAFMAPAHTFDKTTLKVLGRNGINTVTDGHGIYTYQQEGITLVPQIMSRPRVMPFGVYTSCLHFNTMSDRDFIRTENFIVQNRDRIISFDEAVAMTADTLPKKMINLLIRGIFKVRASLRSAHEELPLSVRCRN